MTDTNDAIDRLAKEAKSAARKATDTVLDAADVVADTASETAESVADRTREAAKHLFNEINRARVKGAKRVR